MISNVDIVQTEKYKEMLGLTNMAGTTGTSTFVAQVSILGNLYVSGYSNLVNKITIGSNLTVSGNSIFQNNVSLNSNLYIYNKSLFNDNAYVVGKVNANNMNVNGGLIVNNKILGNVVSLNNIKVSQWSQFNNTLNINNAIALNNDLNISANKIYLGNMNSNINIIGTTTYMAINEIRVLDKTIALNLGSTGVSTNNGEYSGIQIYSSSGVGFIRANEDGTRYEIKAPLDEITRYIATVDYDNNLIISGTTTLYGSTSVFASLNVNGNTIFQGNTIFNSSLITSGNTILANSVTALSNVTISGNTILNNDTSLNSSFYVNGKANFLGATTINSNLDINGDTTILGSITFLSDLNIFGDSLLQGRTSLSSSLYISNISIIQGTTSILSSLNINGKANILGSTSIISDLTVSQKTILQGASNLNTNFNVNGDIIIDGNMTIGSLLKFTANNQSQYSTLCIYSQIISQLPEYENNTTAIAGGVPLWGFYRTGGILKIRLSNIPPDLVLSGLSTISINYSTLYIEPGVAAIDNSNNVLQTYLTSIANTTVSNILSTPILLDNSNIIITQTSRLLIGTYTLLYSATDTTGNIGTITRILNIVDNIIYSTFNNTNIIQTWINSGSPYTIIGDQLTGGQDGAWAFSPVLLSLISFNSSWSVIIKVRAVNWGNILQINFDPSFINWSNGSTENNLAIGLNCGVSNVNFRDSGLYFDNDSTYWQSYLSPLNFYSTFNHSDGLFIKIYRDGTTGLITIAFYDNLGQLIDSKTSLLPIYYTNFNSLFSFTSRVNLIWLKGFIIHQTDIYANVTEFQNYFGN